MNVNNPSRVHGPCNLVVFAVRESSRLQRPVRQPARVPQSVRLQREEEKKQHSLLQVSPQWVAIVLSRNIVFTYKVY